MLLNERIEKYEEEIVKLRDQAFTAYYDLNILSQSRAALIKGRFNLSFAWIIYRAIQAISKLQSYLKIQILSIQWL